MHEMSLCESVLQVLQEQAETNAFSRVNTLWLEIGVLSGVEIESLRFCFQAVSKGTLAENARLEIIRRAALAWCSHCLKEVSIEQRFDACPECGHYHLRLLSGDEMKIKELEVE